MKNKFIIKRKKRLIILLSTTILVVIILLKIFNDNISLFIMPQDVYKSINTLDDKKTFRIGGIVRENSLKFKNNEFNFIIDDNNTKEFPITVFFNGTLPSLFGEGRTAIIKVKLHERKTMSFRALEVLAKHDERYYSKK